LIGSNIGGLICRTEFAVVDACQYAPAFRASMLANSAANGYLRRMFESFEFCLPTKSTSVPDGPDWLHEIKYDGYACVDIGEHVGFARCGDEKGRCSVATGFGEAAEALLFSLRLCSQPNAQEGTNLSFDVTGLVCVCEVQTTPAGDDGAHKVM
jgi:hypothetical protein